MTRALHIHTARVYLAQSRHFTHRARGFSFVLLQWEANARRRAMAINEHQEVAKMNRIARGWGVSDKRKKNRSVTFSVDHIIPLRGDKVSGLHVTVNLRIVKVSENSRKSNSHLKSDTDAAL